MSVLGAVPRETRDTLFLLATIAAIVAPHASHLALWASALTVLVLGWRVHLAWRQQPLPGRLILAFIVVVMVGLTFLTHRTLVGRQPYVTLLVMLLVMKTLELRARRDAFVVFYLGFFLVLTQFLYSQSLLTGLWMLLSVWALLSAVVLAQMPVGQPTLALAARQAARTTALGLPMMVLLFLLFPRIAPLWGVPTENIGRTGLSNQLDFGAMAEIANDDSIAMRLRFRSEPPPSRQRYFRGPVLGVFDGRSWRPTEQGWRRPEALVTAGPALQYEMTLEPLRISVLPLLEMSPGDAGTEISIGEMKMRRGPELQWLTPRPITERLRFDAQAHADYRVGPQRASEWLRAYLRLPEGLNPRSRAWALALREEARFAALPPAELAPALVQAVLDHIARADFTYTLAPGRYGEATPHVIDEFWLDRKLGFCEHFASAFVVLMRSMEVPARIVTGFQGLDPEPQDGYWIVRNSNAHAWAEYWVEGRGWVRADPTAAIAPERISLGQALRPAPSAFEQLNPTLWRSLRNGWESLNNQWQQLVLNYSRQNQFDLLKSIGFDTPDWLALGRFSAGVIFVLALAGALWNWWQGRPHDAWSRQRERVLAELRRWGVGAAAHQPPAQWAALLHERHGSAAASAVELLLALERQRYGAAAAPDDWRARRRWLRRFRAAGRMLAAKPR